MLASVGNAGIPRRHQYPDRTDDSGTEVGTAGGADGRTGSGSSGTAARRTPRSYFVLWKTVRLM